MLYPVNQNIGLIEILVKYKANRSLTVGVFGWCEGIPPTLNAMIT